MKVSELLRVISYDTIIAIVDAKAVGCKTNPGRCTLHEDYKQQINERYGEYEVEEIGIATKKKLYVWVRKNG